MNRHPRRNWKRGIGRGASATIIGVIIIVAALSANFALRSPTYITTSPGGPIGETTSAQSYSSTTQAATQSSQSTTVSNSQSSGSSSTLSVSQQQLVVDETQPPDSMDPAVEFTTPGNEITSNIYQGLVAPDLTSEYTYVGQLASSWTTSANGMNWNFTLRTGVTFSNGDPFTAYDVWYSLYRTMIMNKPPSFILEQNFATKGGAITITNVTLSSMNFANPSAANLTFMETPDQSFQVINQYEIALNVGLGYNGDVPYSALLATLTAPCSYAVDPAVVAAHGGIQPDRVNTWMESNALGTGFYLLSSPWTQGTSITLTRNTRYWGNSLSSPELNYAIQPATINNIIIYYKTVTATIADLKSGSAQMLGASDVSEIGGLSAVQGISNVKIDVLPIQFGSAIGSYYIFLNPWIDPEFGNILVREAVAYAVNYPGIIQAVFDGYGQSWIGPIPPGFPDYNATTAGLSPYSYNDTAAADLLAEAGYQAKLNGATINPGGKVFPTLNFLYTPDISSEFDVAPAIEAELSAIGINVNLVTLSFVQYSNYLFGYGTGAYGMGIGYYTEDYFASQDYVTSLAQDNFTGAPVILANESTFANNAAGAITNTTLIQAYQNETVTMLNHYVLIWLYVPNQVTVNDQDLAGMVPNPVGSCAGYFMYYNDVYYT